MECTNLVFKVGKSVYCRDYKEGKCWCMLLYAPIYIHKLCSLNLAGYHKLVLAIIGGSVQVLFQPSQTIIDGRAQARVGGRPGFGYATALQPHLATRGV